MCFINYIVFFRPQWSSEIKNSYCTAKTDHNYTKSSLRSTQKWLYLLQELCGKGVCCYSDPASAVWWNWLPDTEGIWRLGVHCKEKYTALNRTEFKKQCYRKLHLSVTFSLLSYPLTTTTKEPHSHWHSSDLMLFQCYSKLQFESTFTICTHKCILLRPALQEIILFQL